MPTEKKRDLSIDIVRAICTMLIMLAHVYPPALLMNIRTFDVTVLVLVSGMSMWYESKRTSSSYLSYVWKRIKKLLIPTYLVITIIFVLSFIACMILKIDFIWSGSQILRSYLLTNVDSAVGYAWIVRIFLMLALVSPILKYINSKVESNVYFASIIIAMCAISNIAISLFGIGGNVLYSWGFLYLIPYSVVALIGLRIMSNKEFINLALLLSSGAFIASQIYITWEMGGYFIPNEYKYPPQLYYLSYGLIIGIVAYEFFIKAPIRSGRVNGYLRWISTHSFTIYLMHIFPLMGILMGGKYIQNIKILNNWFIKYLFVVAFALIATSIFEKVKNKLYVHMLHAKCSPRD